MIPIRIANWATAAAISVVAASPHAAHALDFDEIQCWAGHGANRAVLVLDWADGLHPESLAWGYRWESGSPTGRDMLEALARSDPRLHVLLRNQYGGAIFFGAGYDRDGDSGGFVNGSPGSTSETGHALDPDDHYEEGWISQFWQYFNATGNVYSSGMWRASGGGFAQRTLQNGDWDGWRIAAATFPPPEHPTPPARPVAAAPNDGWSLDDIEVWTGAGSNRAVFVADWRDNTPSLAWGYRWNGQATCLDMWRAVTNAPAGPSGTLTNNPLGLAVQSLAYQRPARPTDSLPDVRTAADTTVTAYGANHTPDATPHVWRHWRKTGEAIRALHDAQPAGMVLADCALAHGDWHAWVQSQTNNAPAPRWPLPAVHYPFAATVANYTAGDTNSIGIDWIDGALFTNVITALGRPTVDTTGDWDAFPPSETAPVVPVYPTFRARDIVTVGTNGHLDLAFDHRVWDHPANPYGVDLLVFANAKLTLTVGQSWSNAEPESVTLSGGLAEEGGRILVSQDGSSWHIVSNQLADSAMPTLGRVLCSDHPAVIPGFTNFWWGPPTDPTLPTDPDVQPSQLAGMNLRDLVSRYRGSAGGIPIDISAMPLPADPDTGRKWIQYVRVAGTGVDTPEVDAISDVSPAAPYTRWTQRHFAWIDSPEAEHDDAVNNPHHLANLTAYAAGLAPTGDLHLATTHATINGDDLHIRIPTSGKVPDTRFVLHTASELDAPDWSTNGITYTSQTNAWISLDRAARFIRIGVTHDQ